MLDAEGLIIQVKDPADMRNKLIIPQHIESQQYSGEYGGYKQGVKRM